MADPAYLRATIFPYQDFRLEEVREIRARAVDGCANLILYEVDGIEYLALTAWRRHQTPKYPKPSKLPPPPRDVVMKGKDEPLAPGTEVTVAGRRWVKRGYIHRKARERLLEAADHRCISCGSTENLQIDHKIPISKGGDNRDENLQVLCGSCNSRKRDRHEEAEPEGGSILQSGETLEEGFSERTPRVGLGREGVKALEKGSSRSSLRGKALPAEKERIVAELIAAIGEVEDDDAGSLRRYASSLSEGSLAKVLESLKTQNGIEDPLRYVFGALISEKREAAVA